MNNIAKRRTALINGDELEEPLRWFEVVPQPSKRTRHILDPVYNGSPNGMVKRRGRSDKTSLCGRVDANGHTLYEFDRTESPLDLEDACGLCTRSLRSTINGAISAFTSLGDWGHPDGRGHHATARFRLHTGEEFIASAVGQEHAEPQRYGEGLPGYDSGEYVATLETAPPPTGVYDVRLDVPEPGEFGSFTVAEHVPIDEDGNELTEEEADGLPVDHAFKLLGYVIEVDPLDEDDMAAIEKAEDQWRESLDG